MALFGEVVILAPMPIMTLHSTMSTTLLTTSLFMLAVGLVLALSMDSAAPKDILTATAAYAAILVVFCGDYTTSVENLLVLPILVLSVFGRGSYHSSVASSPAPSQRSISL